MPCYHPIPARRNGSEPPVLWPELGTENLELPCGKCLGCRAMHATAWAHRAWHEASLWQHNSFITLTYNDESLPPESHLDRYATTRFIKRLRQRIRRHPQDFTTTQDGIRYLACGEYGTDNGRPHYHALVFNLAFTDTKRIGVSHGHDLCESETLTALWSANGRPLGYSTVGKATPGAAAGYIAKYALKYAQGSRTGMVDPHGVWKPRPFLRMSLRPAIGKRWLQKYAADLQHGYLVSTNGAKAPIPRYYKNKLKEEHTHLYETLQYYQQIQQLQNKDTDKNTAARRQDAELIHEQKHRNDRRR